MTANLTAVPHSLASRRSPIADWHERHAATVATRRAMAVPLVFAASAPQGSSVQLRDVSWHRRFGCKGPAAETWLIAQGFAVPPGVNRWSCDERGVIVARLATSEFLVECEGAVDAPFSVASDQLAVPQRAPAVYPVVRQDLAIEVSGAALEEFLQQVCSVDFAALLRSGAIGRGEVLLTSMIGVAVVAIVRATAAEPRLTIWSDPSYAHYFWTTLLEVAADLGGGVAACNAQSDSGEL